ncbi:hypothetical protein CEXT_146371 [Caerostris extrusa]|uniref:Uncharacterized protein n=1 Tax=Caerostris extrusa TaxID=172846 RepID=A0AAV4PTN4_CAEEX|nr:hypothetical protein CEXT_146371 [Caerostris extrusa]
MAFYPRNGCYILRKFYVIKTVITLKYHKFYNYDTPNFHDNALSVNKCIDMQTFGKPFAVLFSEKPSIHKIRPPVETTRRRKCGGKTIHVRDEIHREMIEVGHHISGALGK